MSGEYFGEPWPSGICDDGVRVRTPIGELCIGCDEAIAGDDQGWFIGAFREAGKAEMVPQHRECGVRATIGSLGHQMKKCSCYVKDGTSFEDPPGLTKREAALEAWNYLVEHGVS